MKVIIEFNTDNAAFQEDWDGEVDFVMERATQLVREKESWKLLDSNGNKIGTVQVTEK